MSEPLTKEAAKAALTAAAWTDEESGRTTIHSFLGALGADHDLDHALAQVDAADEVTWIDHLFDHDLAVGVDGRVYCYAVKQPAEHPIPPEEARKRSETEERRVDLIESITADEWQRIYAAAYAADDDVVGADLAARIVDIVDLTREIEKR